MVSLLILLMIIGEETGYGVWSSLVLMLALVSQIQVQWVLMLALVFHFPDAGDHPQAYESCQAARRR